MRLKVLDQFPPELDRVAECSPQATFYHSRVWVETLSRSFPSMIFRCIVAEEGNDVTGYLPFFIIKKGPVRVIWSMPFGTYGGPVTLGSDDVFRALIESFAGFAKKFWVYETAWVNYWNRPSSKPFCSSEKVTHIIDLEPGFDAIWSESLDRTKRKQVRRAEKKGVEIVEKSSARDAERFYAVYASRIKAAGGKVHYPESLFVDLAAGGGANVKLFLAYHDQELLGGQLNFYFKDTVIAWYGLTTLESRVYQASVGLYSFCIRHACENGYRKFNLGGSMGKASLMDFKMAFGAVPYRYNVSTIRSAMGKIASAFKIIKSDQ